MKGRSVLITSGPTREFLDPIRFLTNASSGRMGFALAKAARALGARVTVVSGPTDFPAPAGVKVIRVETGLEMLAATLKAAQRADLVIGAAAVSDWRFAARASRKIKRKPGALRLTLLPNPDIIKEVAARRRRGQFVVGFALETHERLKHARLKLAAKGLDAVVANAAGTLSSKSIQATVLYKDGSVEFFKPASKESTSRKLLKSLQRRLG